MVRNRRPKWYKEIDRDGMDRHVLRKDDNNWVRKCVTSEVEGNQTKK